MVRTVLSRSVRTVLVLALALSSAGCLRHEFDLCRGEAPHPDCALLDGGSADGGDAGQTDAGQTDAGQTDAG